MRSALLRGREIHTYGLTDVVGEASAAAALSIGGVRKTYAHTDPNEDAAGFGVGDRGCVLVVADAHDGFEASEVLVESLLANPAPNWTDDEDAPDDARWQRYALAALCDANDDVLRERSSRGGFESTSTVTLALVRPDVNRIYHVAVGDSLLFAIDADGSARELAPCEGRPHFLGDLQLSAENLAPAARIGSAALGDAVGIVAVTDGLSERGIGVDVPADAVAEAAALAFAALPPVRAMTLARAVSEVALSAHSVNKAGDNVGVAAYWRDR